MVTGLTGTLQCGPHLRTLVQQKLRAFTVQTAERDQQHAAVVALVITDEGHGAELPGFPQHAVWRTQAALLLTRRSGHLRTHVPTGI